MSESPRPTADSRAGLSAEEALELAAHVAELAKAGLPLGGGLMALAEELPRGRLRGMLRAMATQLESGATLDVVLEAQGSRFPQHMRGLLLAGIRSGRLGEVLEELVDLERERVELRRRVWRALAYPLLLLSLMAGLLIVLDAFIISDFVKIYEDFGAELPDVTRMFLQASGPGTWMVKIGIVLIVAVAALSWAMPQASWASRTLYAVPLIGPLWRFRRLARFSRMMGLLLEQNVPLPEALRLTAVGSHDAWLGSGCRRVAEEVESGRPLAESLAAQVQFPPSLIPLVEWGQQTSMSADAFRAAAEMFEGRVQSQGVFLEMILLPITFLIVLVFGSTVIAALWLPMISLIQNLM